MKSGLWFLTFSLLILVTAQPVVAKESSYVELTVTNGDTLYDICAEYLEHLDRWTDVARFNRLRNADLIYPGQTLRIPVDLMKGIPLNGMVTFVSGTPRAFIASLNQWKPLGLDNTLTQGDRVETGDTGTVEITYSQGVSFLIRPETTLTIGAANRQSDHHQRFNLFLTIGRAISMIRKITGQECRFEIKTPSALAGARGTQFRVSVDHENNTRCEVQEGVVAMGGAGASTVMVSQGEGIVVAQDGTLDKPRALPMPPGVLNISRLYRTLPIEVALGSVSNATLYRVVLSADDTFKAMLLDRKVSPGQNASIALLDDGTYYLKTSSLDASGLEGDFSLPVAINVRVNPLPPFIQSPADQDQYRIGGVAMKWLSVREAAQYQLQVSRDREFNTLILDQSTITGTGFSTPTLEIGTYFFRVRSIAPDGFQGLWSDTISFIVVPPPPSPPVETPDVDKTSIRLRWKDLGETLSYHLQMSRDPEFGTTLMDTRLTRPQLVFDRPEKAGTYYFRISAIDQNDYEGAFSSPQHLDIKDDTPWSIIGTLIVFLMAIVAM